MKSLSVISNTPWKGLAEIQMYLLLPFVTLYLKAKGVEIKPGFKFYGMPKILRHRESKIAIGSNFENRNAWDSNPLGVNHPTIICTWGKGAQIKIGDDVGITGGSIVANTKVEIGDGTIIGANCTVIDTDFHPIKSKKRRYDQNNIASLPIKIGKNVFVGTGATILKGVQIPDNSIVPAGAVVNRKHRIKPASV